MFRVIRIRQGLLVAAVALLGSGYMMNLAAAPTNVPWQRGCKPAAEAPEDAKQKTTKPSGNKVESAGGEKAKAEKPG